MSVADKATVWCCSNDETCVGKTVSVIKELVINKIVSSLCWGRGTDLKSMEVSVATYGTSVILDFYFYRDLNSRTEKV